MPELDTITIKGFKSIACIEKLKLEAINGPWDYKSQILENHLLELES